MLLCCIIPSSSGKTDEVLKEVAHTDDKGNNIYCYAVWPIKIFVEYVGANMSIQVLLLVIDRRCVSVMST